MILNHEWVILCSVILIKKPSVFDWIYFYEITDIYCFLILLHLLRMALLQFSGDVPIFQDYLKEKLVVYKVPSYNHYTNWWEIIQHCCVFHSFCKMCLKCFLPRTVTDSKSVCPVPDSTSWIQIPILVQEQKKPS